MSAVRKIRRRQWRDEIHSSAFNLPPLVERPASLTFHVWSIARGYRDKLYQLALRARHFRESKRETGSTVCRR